MPSPIAEASNSVAASAAISAWARLARSSTAAASNASPNSPVMIRPRSSVRPSIRFAEYGKGLIAAPPDHALVRVHLDLPVVMHGPNARLGAPPSREAGQAGMARSASRAQHRRDRMQDARRPRYGLDQLIVSFRSLGEHRMMLRPRDSNDQRLLKARLKIPPRPHRLA